MDWKEIFKVSGIMGAVAVVVLLLMDMVSDEPMVGTFLIAVVGTGLILNRKLKKNEDWGILIGILLSLVVFEVLAFLLFDLLLI